MTDDMGVLASVIAVAKQPWPELAQIHVVREFAAYSRMWYLDHYKLERWILP